MQALQYDTLSLEAESLLPEYLPHVPEGPERTLLQDWDLRYEPGSEAKKLKVPPT